MPRHQAAVRPRTFTRVRAVLAGALVLGVGSAVTLASWTDGEYSQGSFSASVFNTESSVNLGVAWADNVSSPGATMTFNSAGMSPGTFRYGSLWIRAKMTSDSGTLSLGAPAITNTPATVPTLGSALLYRVVTTTAATTTCDGTMFTAGATYLVGSFATPAALTAGGSATTGVAAGAATLPGTTTKLCFEVSLPTGASNLLQGKAAGAIWLVTATSTN